MRLEGFLGSVKLRQAIACKVREHKIYFSARATICRKYPVCKKRAAPGRVFSPLSETDATGTQRFVGNTESVRAPGGFSWLCQTDACV